MATSDDIQKSKVIEFWRAIEYFSPQNVPKLNTGKQKEPVFVLLPEGLAPWMDRHPVKSQPIPAGFVRRHTVFGGVYNLSVIREVLARELSRPLDKYDELPVGESCLFSLTVSDQGRPVFDSITISNCAWAAGQTIRNGGTTSRGWLEGFEEAAQRTTSDLRAWLSADRDSELVEQAPSSGVGRVVNSSDLLTAVHIVAHELGLESIVGQLPEVRVKSGYVWAKNELVSNEQDFLNSFFVGDLTRLREHIGNGKYGQGLASYLKPRDSLDRNSRIDVRESIAKALEMVVPASFPRGHWPTNGGYPLVLSQQLAVNAAYSTLLSKSGIFSINGPPGSGKTTLIRELVAGNVVERALLLAGLSRPQDAFSGETGQLTFPQFRHQVHILRKEFSGFEMVIASSNNGAVENVSLELPILKAIDAEFLHEDIYFSDVASYLIQRPAWGLIAARLGNKANRNEFISRVWYRNDDHPIEQSPTGLAIPGLRAHLKMLSRQEGNWQQAKSRFKTALENESTIRSHRIQVHALWIRTGETLRKVRAIEAILPQQLEELLIAAAEEVEAQKTLAEFRATEEDSSNRRLQHLQFKPSFWETLLSLGKAYKAWQAKDVALLQLQEDCQQKRDKAQAEHHIKLEERNRKQRIVEVTQSDLDATRQMLDKQQSSLDEARQVMGDHVPDVETPYDDSGHMELSSPWADPAWNRARAKLFLEALGLHRAFIEANSHYMLGNLSAAMDLIQGKVPLNASVTAVSSAWSSLFFLLPLVSTTFASFDRLFATLGQENIGWLFVDEAGQAAPQVAAGAIWRSRRTVVLGDPLQLEPVTVIPVSIQEALREHFEVSEEWLPGVASVQEIADQTNQIGTYLHQLETPLWVGAPLRIHRRCEQPMFSISNRIAYDGSMVYGTPIGDRLDLPPSRWIHVEGESSDGHWIEAEGLLAQQLVLRLVESGLKAREIMVLSPFRKVADQLRLKLGNTYDGITVGTVHVAQGKEATAVVLVLGSDPASPGARRWAASTPNLLNVAVSRAKRRLFVVGNRRLWSQQPYFNTAATILSEYARGTTLEQSETMPS